MSFDKGREDLKAGFLYSLLGSAVQRVLIEKHPEMLGRGISRQRLYKVLANVIWDWNWLVSEGGPDGVQLNPSPIFKWLPNRFGAVGVVAPSLEYTVPRWIGTVDFEHLPRCGAFGRFGPTVVAADHNPSARFGFPEFISYPEREKAPVDPRDQHYWELLATLYGKCAEEFGVETMDALASCKTATSAFHSLWVQVVYWRESCLTIASVLKNGVDPATNVEERTRVESAVNDAGAAAANFSRKIRYWKDHSVYLGRVAPIFSASELARVAPTVRQLRDCPYAERLDRICTLEDYIQSATLLIKSGCVTLGYGRSQSDFTRPSPERVDRAFRICELVVGRAIGPPDKEAQTLFNAQGTDISLIISELVQFLEERFEGQIGLRLLEHDPHCESFLRDHYPWKRRRKAN